MTRFAAATLLLSALACASPVGPRPVTAESIRQAAPVQALATADTADVLITALEQTAAVRVGQTVGLKPFRDGVRWQVTFSNTDLQLMTPLDRLAAPGDEGWVWKALVRGTTEITLTSVSPHSSLYLIERHPAPSGSQ